MEILGVISSQSFIVLNIDYDAWILTGTADGEDLSFADRNEPDQMNGEFVLPPRCEVYRQIHVVADRDFVSDHFLRVYTWKC